MIDIRSIKKLERRVEHSLGVFNKVITDLDNKQKEQLNENPVQLDLSNVDEVRKAFIASEIFNRKY